MKKLSVFAVAFAALSLLAHAASANGRWPNWYVGLHGSLDFVDDVEVDGNPVVNSYNTDLGYGAGASIGYRPALQNTSLSNLRFEVEWNYLSAAMDKVDSTFGKFSGHGTTVVNAIMGNVFYDFVMRDQRRQTKPIMPYFGAGVGWADVRLRDTDTTLGNLNDNDQVLAYQLMAGISYAPKSIPFTEWTLGYRFFDSVDPEYSYVAGDKFTVDIMSHNVEAGVRFLF